MPEEERQFKLSPEQRKLARNRQANHREKLKEQQQQERYEKYCREDFDDRREQLGVVSMLETSPDVFVETPEELLTLTREFARRLAVPIRPDDTLKTFFARTFTRWIERRSPGLDRAHDQFIWNCLFGYSKQAIQPIVDIIGRLAGADDPIDVSALPPLPFRCAPAKPAAPVDAKVEKAHHDMDETRQAEAEILRGEFSVVDTGSSFQIVAKSHAERGERGWSFPRIMPSEQVWVRWDLIGYVNKFLQTNPDDPRFDQSARDRIARVYEYRALQVRANRNHGLEE